MNGTVLAGPRVVEHFCHVTLPVGLFPQIPSQNLPLHPKYSYYSMGLACKVSLRRRCLRSFLRFFSFFLYLFSVRLTFTSVLCNYACCFWSFHLFSASFTSILLLFVCLILPLCSFLPSVLFIFLYFLVFFHNKLSLNTVLV